MEEKKTQFSIYEEIVNVCVHDGGVSQSQHGGQMTATQRLFLLLSPGLQSRWLTLRTSLRKLSSDLHMWAPAFTHTSHTVINTKKLEWKNVLCLGKAEMTKNLVQG